VDASGRTELLDDPHNLVLSIAASTGLVGVLAWLAVAAAAIASVFALMRDCGPAADSGLPGRSGGGLDPGICGHISAVAGGLAGLVVGVQFHFVTLETGALGAVLIGALLGLQAANAPGASEVIETPRRPRGGRWIASGAAIVFVSLGIVAAALVGADAHVRVGFDAASAGAWERAESAFARARSLAPWEPAFLWAEGRAATAAVQNAADGRALAQGRSALAEAVERMPGDARPLRDIGDLEVTAALAGLGQGGWGRAESAYTDALAYAPVDPKAWLGRGVARMMLGDMTGAESDILRAVEIAPSFAVAWANLAELYTADGRTSEATAARARAAAAESAQ
jgi:tetratricopeptide (TPR) repeat protein